MDENETKLFRVHVDGGFHKRFELEALGALYYYPRGTKEGTKETKLYRLRIRGWRFCVN